jgi:hypothetical protein
MTRLRGQAGLGFSLAAIAEREQLQLPAIPDGQVLAQNVSAELAEKALSIKYPAVYVYCDKISNTLREKFRTFSGTASMNVEVRTTHDHLEELDRRVQLYVEAITGVLDNNRGNWPHGMFYSGGYEVQFGAVKHGGKNFLQAAKVRFEVNISSD